MDPKNHYWNPSQIKSIIVLILLNTFNLIFTKFRILLQEKLYDCDLLKN